MFDLQTIKAMNNGQSKRTSKAGAKIASKAHGSPVVKDAEGNVINGYRW